MMVRTAASSRSSVRRISSASSWPVCSVRGARAWCMAASLSSGEYQLECWMRQMPWGSRLENKFLPWRSGSCVHRRVGKPCGHPPVHRGMVRLDGGFGQIRFSGAGGCLKNNRKKAIGEDVMTDDGTFLKNSWYVAAWNHELIDGKKLARTILER